MKLSPREIARMIDLSCVQAGSTLDEIRGAVETAKKFQCICVFALPAHTPMLVDLLKDETDILVGGVVGFPDGGATTEGKAGEAAELKAMGVNELDMVINIAWLKSGLYEKVTNDIREVIKAGGGLPVKVILECHHLTDEEIITACRLCVDAGASFVKTGTGWAPTGATPENVRLMSETVGGECGVKAAGGVRDLETLLNMHELGATRFGLGAGTAAAILTGVVADGDDGAY